MEKPPASSLKYLEIPIVALALVGLYLTSLYSYLLFHSLAEIFSIIIACGIFMLAFNSRKFTDNNYLLFIGIAYLFVGNLDLLHTLSYEGMKVFRQSGSNLATQLWIAARYLESASLILAFLLLKKRLKTRFMFIGFSIIFSVLIISIFYWKIFPDCFIEGVGLTPFKVASEYVISLMLLGSIGLLFKRRSFFDPRVLRLLVASIAMTIGSELAFTLYKDAYGFFNLLGHFLKLISFYLIYKAIIETYLLMPYSSLFRSLKRSEEALRESEARYRNISVDLAQAVDKKVEELRQAESLASIGRMVSVVAHEIRNPLHNIYMGVDSLRMRLGGNEELLEIMGEIDYGVESLNSTVKELLDYSRPVNLEYALWPIQEIVEQAVNTLTDKVENTTIQVNLDHGNGGICVDAAKMVRVFANLILNAVEAMPEGGNIDIHSKTFQQDSANVLLLSISDNGTGIDENDIEHIQDPFVTTKPQGTGLGIPICRKIIEAHEGSLRIKSTVNEGTTVEITLPIKNS